MSVIFYYYCVKKKMNLGMSSVGGFSHQVFMLDLIYYALFKCILPKKCVQFNPIKNKVKNVQH